MRPAMVWQGTKPGLRNALYLAWLLALIMTPILISELLYAALD
jgi:hypothetical protein